MAAPRGELRVHLTGGGGRPGRVPWRCAATKLPTPDRAAAAAAAAAVRGRGISGAAQAKPPSVGLQAGPAQEPRVKVPSQDLRCAVGGWVGRSRTQGLNLIAAKHALDEVVNDTTPPPCQPLLIGLRHVRMLPALPACGRPGSTAPSVPCLQVWLAALSLLGALLLDR
ncbi:hypothetical protein VTN02DRAFT_1932 [Thermoascus thermophilus]